jgi:hypothetical protein
MVLCYIAKSNTGLVERETDRVSNRMKDTFLQSVYPFPNPLKEERSTHTARLAVFFGVDFLFGVVSSLVFFLRVVFFSGITISS